MHCLYHSHTLDFGVFEVINFKMFLKNLYEITIYMRSQDAPDRIKIKGKPGPQGCGKVEHPHCKQSPCRSQTFSNAIQA